MGKLIYLCHTRPKAYAMSVVSQFIHSLREVHLEVVNKILCYLKFILGKGIMFERNEVLSLEAYSDADLVNSLVDRRSMSWYCTFLGRIWWNGKVRNNLISRSNIEVELKVMPHGICELLCLKIIFEDLIIQ